MFFRKTKLEDLWKPEYDMLAKYNAEVSRGIVHTEDWAMRMKNLQEDFDARKYELVKEQGHFIA